MLLFKCNRVPALRGLATGFQVYAVTVSGIGLILLWHNIVVCLTGLTDFSFIFME